MLHKEKNISASETMILLLVMVSVLILKVAYIRDIYWYWGLLITLPLLLLAIIDERRKKRAFLVKAGE